MSFLKRFFVFWFLILIFTTSVQAQLVKVNPGLFVGQKEEDLYFAAEKVDRFNIEFWRAFIEWQKVFRNRLPSGSKMRLGISDSILGFQSYIDDFRPGYSNYELWVVYATSSQKIKRPRGQNRRFFNIKNSSDALRTFESLEMTFCLATSEQSPFVTHMGIGRGLAYANRSHKQISLDLHSFAAKVTLAVYPKKIYMITTPTLAMRQQFTLAYPKDEMYLGDNNYLFSLEQLEQKQNSESDPKSEEMESALGATSRALEDYRRTPSPIYSDEEWFVIDDPSRKIYFKVDQDSEEYSWFFNHSVQRQRPPEYIWTVFPLDSLARYGKLID